MAALNQQLPRDKNMNNMNLGNSDVFPRLLVIMRLPTLSVTRGVVFDPNSRNPDLVCGPGIPLTFSRHTI